MKLLAALILALATVFNAPTVCAHAMDGAPATMSSAHDHMGSDESHHAHMPHGPMNDDAPDAPDAPQHHGCDEDCKGGPGCDGCAAPAASVLPAQASLNQDAPHTVMAFPISRNMGYADRIDPPPPRA